MYKVLLVDDEALIREAISENIPWEELGFELIGSCENGREAMEQIPLNPPNLLLTDIYMPYVDGLELARYTHENYPDTKIVIISGYDEFEYAKQAVRYQVMEYILKPMTPAELTEVLVRVRESLDEDNARLKTLKKLRGAYAVHKPLLQARFLNSLLRGRERPEGLEDKMQELEISLPGSIFNTAIVEGDDLTPFLELYPGMRDELVLFSICNISTEIIEQKELGVVFQDMEERTVIILCGNDRAEMEKRMEEALKEIQKTILDLLKVETTICVGVEATDICHLYQSFEKARAVNEMKFLFGGNQILRADLRGEPKKNLAIDVPHWAERVSMAVKAGDSGEIEQSVRDFAQEIRNAYVNRNRTIMYVQNLLLTVVNTANLTEDKENQIMQEEKELLNRIYTYDHLTDMATDVIGLCNHMAQLLGEQRDSYGKKQAMLAKEYIDSHYMDSDMSLNTVCSYLAMSTSYFSTLFKTYTGETFIEALTRKRMEKAKELLENTSMKAYEIADEVGFSDPHYFSIAFKKATGKTPTEYAKETRRQ
jgi:two-component system response regulator YesN